MKKSIFLWAALCLMACVAFSACSNSDKGGNERADREQTEKHKKEKQYLVGQLEGEDDYVVVNSKSEVIAAGFANEPYNIGEGVACVDDYGVVTMYELGKKPKVIKGLDDLKSAGQFVDGLAPVTKEGERISIVNKDGKEQFKLAPIDKKEIVWSAAGYKHGYLKVTDEDGNEMLIDKSGNKATAKKYKHILYYDENILFVADSNEEKYGTTYKVVKFDGTQVFKLKDNQSLPDFNEYGIVVYDGDGKCGIYNFQGEYFKAPKKVKIIGQFNDDYYTYLAHSDKCGVMKRGKDGDEEVVSAKYKGIIMLEGGDEFIALNSKDKLFLVDTKGNETQLLPEIDKDDIKNVFMLDDIVFEVADGDEYKLYDKNGKQLGDKTFGGIWDSNKRRVFSDYDKNKKNDDDD